MSSSGDLLRYLGMYLPSILTDIFMLVVAIYFISQIKNTASILILIGAIVNILGLMFSLWINMNNQNLADGDYKNMEVYWTIVRMISFIGQVLLGLGLLFLVNAFVKKLKPPRNTFR